MSNPYRERAVIKRGDKFEVIEATTHVGLTHWRGIAYTGSFSCVIPKGMILVAGVDAVVSAPGFSCAPLRYWRPWSPLVPRKYRWNPLFAGYSFVFRKEDIGELLRRV